MHIQIAESAEFIPVVRELFVEYSESLGVDLCFQGFVEELANLPGDYARPAGRLFLALDNNRPAGCGALRRIDNHACEMKRLYVRPEYRGKGVGRELIDALMASARESGYGSMRLDTLPSMTKAIALYRRLGFREIAPYRANPVPGALFFEYTL
ncbi:MAG TPA: GNAT family N-acetyltransferase [Candidatus Acidoferrales bacterium]|nr:GNAT family N-acetyltransferase [Candidatus Acidoferrales bacterium]